MLNSPSGITLSPEGVIYICDTQNHVIQQATPTGVRPVAGTGKKGYSGDGGAATNATLNEPTEVRLDAEGNIFVVERMNHVVRKIHQKTGIISTIAGTGKAGFEGDGGLATGGLLNEPQSIQFDSNQDLFICDTGNNRIRKVEKKTGLLTTFLGNGKKVNESKEVSWTNLALNGPAFMDLDKLGNIWLVLSQANVIWKIRPSQKTVEHIAGTGKSGNSGDGGPAEEATLGNPSGISAAPDGNIYFADTQNHRIRFIDTREYLMQSFAGTGEKGDGPYGLATDCKFNSPRGIFVDTDGAVYVGDTGNHRVRVIMKMATFPTPKK